MVIYHLKDLILRKSAETNRKIQYSDITKETGISRVTLTRMASKMGHKVNVDIIEKLCLYFDVTPDKLMTIVPDPTKTEKQA